MGILKRFKGPLRLEEYIALAGFGVAMLVNLIAFPGEFSVSRSLLLMVRYFTFGDPFYGLFFLGIICFFFGILYIRFSEAVSARVLQRKRISFASWLEMGGYLLFPFRLLAPIVLMSVAFYPLLDNLNYYLRNEPNDALFWTADERIFGVVPFLWLPTHIHSLFWIRVFEYTYFSLSLVMSVTLFALLFWGSAFLFRKAVLAFVLSLFLAYPLFYMLPCQDPNNYFLKNIRHAEFSPAMQKELAAYNPSPLVTEVINKISSSETDESRDNAVPVTCFPSMHSVWTVFVVYFFAKLSLWSLIITMPWSAALLTGGTYFAQHYVVDYIIGCAVAIVSLLLAHACLRLENLYQHKKNFNVPL